MPDQHPPSAPEVLAEYVTDEQLAAYEKLRAHGGVLKEEAAQFVGSARLARELTDTGLAYVIPHTATSPATFQAAPLDLALMGALAGMQARIMREQKLLLDGNRKLTELQTCAARADSCGPEHLMTVITDRSEVLEKSRELITSAHRDWMTLDNGQTDMPITDDYAVDTIPAMRQQVRKRAIYDSGMLENPAAMRCIRLCAAGGEESRTLPSVEAKMLIIDETAVMLPLSRTGHAGAVLFYAEPIVKLARSCFEMKWVRSTPIGCSGGQGHSPLSDLTLQILELLARGKSDESVAAVIGMSKSTVQRYLDPVKELLGLRSSSRFELGFAVGRSSLLDNQASNQASKEHR
jgi:DNA-binding CsgD family transcriptional regulator